MNEIDQDNLVNIQENNQDTSHQDNKAESTDNTSYQLEDDSYIIGLEDRELINYAIGMSFNEKYKLYRTASDPYGSDAWYINRDIRFLYKKNLAMFMVLYAIERRPSYLRGLKFIIKKATTTLEPILKSVTYKNITMSLLDCYIIRYSEYIRLKYMDQSAYFMFSGLNAKGHGVILVSTIFLTRFITYLLGSRSKVPVANLSKLSNIEYKIAKRTFIKLILSHIAGSFSVISPCKFTIHNHGNYNADSPMHIFDHFNAKIIVSSFSIQGYNANGKMDIIMPLSMIYSMISSITTNTFVKHISHMMDREDFVFIKGSLLKSNMKLKCVIQCAKMTVRELLKMKKGDIIRLKRSLEDEDNEEDDTSDISPNNLNASLQTNGAVITAGKLIHNNDKNDYMHFLITKHFYQ